MIFLQMFVDGKALTDPWPWGEDRDTKKEVLKDYRKSHALHPRFQSGHHQVLVDKKEEGCGHGLDVATWMRTGEVGMPKKEVDPATGRVIGGSRQITDLTMPVSCGFF